MRFKSLNYVDENLNSVDCSYVPLLVVPSFSRRYAPKHLYNCN